MANYAITDHVTEQGTLEEVAAALETYIETVDNTKSIRYLRIHPEGNLFRGVVLHDA